MNNQHSIGVGGDNFFFKPKEMSTDARDMDRELRSMRVAENSTGCNTEGVRMKSTNV